MFISDLVALASDYENVYIAGHVNPDGDCVGSTLALAQLLQKRSVKTKVLLKDVPNTYEYLPVSEWVTDVVPESIDLLIVLDCGDIDRLGIFQTCFEHARMVVNIDHHMSNTQFGHYNHVIDSASSTSEVVYEMIEDQSIMDSEIATALYTGIVYDTGVFKHSNTTERTHFIAGMLISYDIDFTEIINRLFYYKSLAGLKVQNRAIENIQMFSNNKIVLTYLTCNEIGDLNATKKETEGIVQILNEIENVECAVFIFETAMDEYKVSFRSRGQVDVCVLAQTFGGGGHKRASGCSVEGHLSIVIQKIVSLINEQFQASCNL